ncbi:hypothetical protein [Pectobacterium carotovorum]|uniref:Transmembrane protein n=1 Tax=Pectobacterium carotovorum subsp. carotovorum TaxID=555 RepID=A0AAI9L253_PECCC|nr:hypothetical protein [Pectobacterium carotovorum]KHT34381.1 hypothetical protein RD01_05680 [Pectobacterium carotovorum subsp. carotovorum]GKX47964.1 hypothetical protein SOASR016_27160 [Pectobacterium carotovorum subsp. carotovorum]GLV70408.1 hypothetical protein Pcaca03_28520 [Pectobacterium carotovorum subsp. carotovorum]
MNNSESSNVKSSEEDEIKELIERAKILFDHQKEQYISAVASLRRLEDKAMKTFGSLSVIISVALLIVRNWWDTIFTINPEPKHIVCWIFLSTFIFLSMVSWGFAFSAMQLRNTEKPSADAQDLEDFFMLNKRYNSLASYAKEYSRLTISTDVKHSEIAKLIANCFESMLFGAWAFIGFLFFFLLIKIS